MLLIVLAYFLGLLVIAHFTSKNSDNQSFFVGNKKSYWWLVAFGMIGTSLSGMTFISVPGTVGLGAFSYFQVVIGYWIGYFIVAFVLLPIYYKMNLTSIYTYLEKRLGVNAHKTGAIFFILSRTVGATLRLYLVIKVLEIFILKDLNVSFELTSVVILGLILLYTYRGGVKTIVWTDTLQTTFMLLALIISLIYVSHLSGSDLIESWNLATKNGLTKIMNTDVNSGGFFLKQIIGGMFITIAMTGLDQEMMQKNISVSNLKDSQKNMSVMGTLQMVVVFIFLFLGAVLTMYAQSNQMQVTAGDDLFPTIAMQSGLPFFISVCFIIGLISALFPSADGALTALTSSFCIDILGVNPKETNSENQKKITRTRLFVHSTFAVLFLLFIFFFREIDNGSLIDILLKLAGFTYGPLLGLFAFGILTKRNVRKFAPILISLISLILTFVLDAINNYQWYQDKMNWSDSLKMQVSNLSSSIFGDYKIGVELIVLNGLLTFLGLWLVSKKSNGGISEK
jgi:Na+/proline symporter